MESKRGITTAGLVIIVFLAFFMLIILAIISYSVGIADEKISGIDFNMPSSNMNMSFNQTYQSIMHPGMVALSVSVPRNIGIGTLLGMVLCLMIVGTKTKRKSKLWIILDIFIIILAEIIAVIVTNTFKDQILSLSPELQDIFINTLSASSKWVLNMPTLIPTIGVLVMITTYMLKKDSTDPNDQEDEGGFDYSINDNAEDDE